MARPKNKSDEIYNARRRYARKAERQLKKADTTTGAAKSRYEAQARENLEKALALKSNTSKLGKALTKLTERLNVKETSVKLETSELLSQSYKQLEKSKKKTKREALSADILTIGNVGSRFYGGLVDIWGVDAESRKHPNQAILDWFGVKDLSEVLEMLENAGIDIYSPVENDSIYRSTQLEIQEFVMAHKHASARN